MVTAVAQTRRPEPGGAVQAPANPVRYRQGPVVVIHYSRPSERSRFARHCLFGPTPDEAARAILYHLDRAPGSVIGRAHGQQIAVLARIEAEGAFEESDLLAVVREGLDVDAFNEAVHQLHRQDWTPLARVTA